MISRPDDSTFRFARAARHLVLALALCACRVEEEPRTDLSQIEQEVHGICELLPEQMAFCAFPGANGFRCHCDRQLCLEVMQQCQVPDEINGMSWWQFCFQSCPVEAVEVPPFNPAEDCEELLANHSLPHWHICNYPRCWDLEPGETCIVPYGGGGSPES